MKRVLDIGLASAGLLALAPFFVLIAVIIKATDRGPVWFRQVRVGRFGQEFRIWKFRTMVVDAEKLGIPLTVGRDPRITGIGHWLRKFKIDELPQLINVLAGEMSLVGPRPEVPKYVTLYDHEQRQVLDLIPGITDPASIRYCDENDLLAAATDPEQTYRTEIMPEKIRLNLAYAERATATTDIVVMVNTVLRLAGARRVRPTGTQDVETGAKNVESPRKDAA